MTKLEFRGGTTFLVVSRNGDHVGEYSVQKGTWQYQDYGAALTGGEREQIAAKLRELNGDPNTRALELHAALEGLWEHYNERYKTDPNKTYWEGKMDGMDNALSAFDNAFPAELKEKESNNP